jgi:hypothetical protein
MPQRPTTHIVGDQAVLALRNALPKAWIFREPTSDYGIDGEIEIVTETGLVTGALIKVQVKGTASSVSVCKTGISVAVDSVRYWLALPIPVVIVRVTENPNKVLWLDVRQYLIEKDRLEAIYSTKQQSIFFNFSGANALPRDDKELEEIALTHQSDVSGMRGGADDVVTQFTGYIILTRVFNSDIDACLRWLRESGSNNQVIEDFPFFVWVKQQSERDPDLLNRIRKMVEDRIASPEVPAV